MIFVTENNTLILETYPVKNMVLTCLCLHKLQYKETIGIWNVHFEYRYGIHLMQPSESHLLNLFSSLKLNLIIPHYTIIMLDKQ